MLLKWLNAGEATELGTTLADDFVARTATEASGTRHRKADPGAHAKQFRSAVHRCMERVDREARPLQLNVFKRAKLANTFKWRLLEKGIERQIADELTQALVLRLSTHQAGPDKTVAATAGRSAARNVPALLAKGDECMDRGDHAEALECYRALLNVDPRHAIAHNNLGAALIKLGRLAEAEEQFRRAIAARAKYADAHVNLAAVLQWTGRIAESELPVRRALRWQPTHRDALFNLGVALELSGRLREANEVYGKLLRVAPDNAHALLGLGRIAGLEGRLAEAEALFTRALDGDRKNPAVWAALVGLRKMTSADSAWLQGALQAAEAELIPVEESQICFALGKYYDDVADFAQAFRHYRRGNELQKPLAPHYDREGRTRWVDDVMRAYTRERLSGAHPGSSESTRPVFVVGMMRSGTSLVEQIIASHPAASGVGELDFWHLAAGRHEAVVRQGLPGESLRSKLAGTYLQTLAGRSADASRVVDKATVNCDYLGLIHSTLPRARMIYLRRDPVDTCLSCYFQRFSSSATHNFTWDLSDLAHYYREHRRLVDHWRTALPPGTLLDVPYEELIADQEGWTRRILDFIGLEWDERCLEFHKTQRPVLTASFWQVRQKIYRGSVDRWRNYQKFIGPLLSLRDDEA